MLSVVVSSHNRRQHLARLLDALRAQLFSPEEFEVVVVLDGSTDGSADLLRAASTPFRLRLVEQPHRGLAATRNTGLREAAGHLVVFLDDDLRPVPDFLAAHARAHSETRARVFVIGYCPPDLPGAGYESLHLRAVWEDQYRRKGAAGHRWSFLDFADGNLSFRRELLLEHGGYDERFAGRRQDWELAVRLLDAGEAFAFARDAEARHALDGRLATRLRHVADEGRSDVLLARKHPHVTGRLRLADVARDTSGSPARRVFYDRLLPRRPLLRGGSPVLSRLERAGAKRAWDRLAGLVIGEAYLSGVREQLPSVRALEALVAPALAGADTEEVILEIGADDVLPAVSGTRPVDLVLTAGGRRVGRVPVFQPGAGWDADDLVARAAAATGRADALTSGRLRGRGRR